MRNGPQILEDSPVVRGADIGNRIADGFGRLQVLAQNVCLVRGKDFVELREHSGNVFMDVNQPVRLVDLRQLDVGKIHAVERAA